jgi:SAM-dependent methyltransferase
MPKIAYFEAGVHQFLHHARHIADVERVLCPQNYPEWQKFLTSVRFIPQESDTIDVSWKYPRTGHAPFSLKQVRFYVRGDTSEHIRYQRKMGVVFHEDRIKKNNDRIIFGEVVLVARSAGMRVSSENTLNALYDGRYFKHFADEERLFDTWAQTTNMENIDVKLMNESPTAPEMRYIMKLLGDVSDKRILDLGCGLGEASVYFSLKGARVTAVDLSAKMLGNVRKLAAINHIKVRTVRAAVEHLPFPKSEKFDIVYAGNLFHHVNIALSFSQLLPHMHAGSILVCWEPVQYNPVINIYRRIARNVRSFDERPIRLSDIDLMHRYFREVRVQWFWLTSLLVFLVMFFWQRRNPNRERFWKSVVREGPKWAWLYTPLENLDRMLMTIFPKLGPLCWNVVIYLQKPELRKFGQSKGRL